MIFDSDFFNEVYQDYIAYQDPLDLEDLCDEVHGLIEAIAVSISPTLSEDLSQEGHLKFLQLCQSGVINPERGSVYSFLSFALRNHMIDYLRGLQDTDELTDLATGKDYTANIDISNILDAMQDYAYDRFPSLQEETIEPLITYIFDAIREEAKGKARGIIQTMQTLFGLNRSQSYAIYHSCVIFLRCELLGIGNYDAMLDAVAKAKEFSLVPDFAYVTGFEMNSPFYLVMKGSYVKF